MDDESPQCVVCGETLTNNHKCNKAAETRFNRSEGAKEAAKTRRELARYGVGKTIGERIGIGFEIMHLSD
jgi:hypothetical protein